jgi:chemotaxis protein MotB
MRTFHLAIIFSAIVLLSSCVSKKKFNDLTLNCENCKNELELTKKALMKAEAENGVSADKINSLNDEIAFLKQNYTNLLDRLSDMSVLSKSQAESVRKSLEKIDDQSKYIKDLTSSAARKDSINLHLVMNLKKSLNAFDESGDIEISVKKGVVYVSISDKLLFASGSYNITPQAKEVLGKVAQIVNNQPDIEILVEGHTDPVPYASGVLQDNWDLSVKRATSVVRMLQNEFKVAPSRMTAGGRSEFVPKDSNETAKGRATNRRTEIIIIPLMDQFFRMVEPQN